MIRHVADASAYQLEFGEWRGGSSPRCERIQAVLTEAGLKTAMAPNIVELMWRKFVLISAASVFAVARGPIGRVWSSELEAVLLQALSESMAVANAEGITLPDTLSNTLVGFDAKVPPEYKPSLLLDLERGNRLEVEAISGVVSRLGKKSGIPTPINDLVYACLKPYANATPKAS